MTTRRIATYNLRPSARTANQVGGPTTYIVTGGAGFIGSHICDNLVKTGHTVVCIDNFNNFYDPKIKWSNLKELKKHKNFKIEKADILDTKKINKIFKKYLFHKKNLRPFGKLKASHTTYNSGHAIVIHLAARAGVRPSLKDPLLYEDVNIKGTLNILNACVQHNIKKLVFASSSSVYGNNRKVPFSESDSVDNPISPYAATKKACELLCYNYHHHYKLPIVCLRFFTVYGPRQRPEMAIHKFIHAIDKNQPITLYGKGDTFRDYTFIDDIVAGVLSSIKKKINYEIINLGNSDTISLKKLVATIETQMGKKANIKKMPEQPGDVKRTFADVRKARKMLGYKPTTNITEGIKKTIEWYFNK